MQLVAGMQMAANPKQIEAGKSRILGPGNPELWDLKIQKFGIQKMKNLKIQIRSAQNVDKVWISRTKSSWPHLGQFQAFFLWVRKMSKRISFVFPIFLGGPMHFSRDVPCRAVPRSGGSVPCQIFPCRALMIPCRAKYFRAVPS